MTDVEYVAAKSCGGKGEKSIEVIEYLRFEIWVVLYDLQYFDSGDEDVFFDFGFSLACTGKVFPTWFSSIFEVSRFL